MNFNLFKNSNTDETSKNEDKENKKINKKTVINESDIFFNTPKNNRNLTYDNEVIMKLTNENEIQNNEISLLKSKFKKINYDYILIKEKHKNEVNQLYNENQQLKITNGKIKKEKEKYINKNKLLQINNNKLQNDINILKSQIEINIKNENKYIEQISNLIEEINFLKEQNNNIMSNNNSALQNYELEINDLKQQLNEKKILENEINALINNEEMQFDNNINQSLSQSINFVNKKMQKILSENSENESGNINEENRLYINIRKLIDEFNEIKKLVNKKDNQIINMKEDKNILINFNNKLIFENNLLKQHINKLIVNIDLYINQNHLAVKKINQLENYIENNINNNTS